MLWEINNRFALMLSKVCFVFESFLIHSHEEIIKVYFMANVITDTSLYPFRNNIGLFYTIQNVLG